MSNAKLLSRAAEIIQAGPDVRETDGEVWDTARFEKACLDWLAEHSPTVPSVELVFIGRRWYFSVEGGEIAHKHRHIALAKAVVAVSKQEKAK